MPRLQGFRKLAGNRSFWAASLAYGVLTGVFSGWSAYLLPNLKVSSLETGCRLAADK